MSPASAGVYRRAHPIDSMSSLHHGIVVIDMLDSIAWLASNQQRMSSMKQIIAYGYDGCHGL